MENKITRAKAISIKAVEGEGFTAAQIQGVVEAVLGKGLKEVKAYIEATVVNTLVNGYTDIRSCVFDNATMVFEDRSNCVSIVLVAQAECPFNLDQLDMNTISEVSVELESNVLSIKLVDSAPWMILSSPKGGFMRVSKTVRDFRLFLE